MGSNEKALVEFINENHTDLGKNFQSAIKRGWSDAANNRALTDCPYRGWKVGKSNYVRAWPRYWSIGWNAYTVFNTCKGCGEELCGPCRLCESYGCTCGSPKSDAIMIYADSDAINRDYHFEKESMGHWYCDSCAFQYEMDFDDRECEQCGGNKMAAAPCANCHRRFCLECDGGTYADKSVFWYDFPPDALGEFYCDKCVILYERS